MRASMADEDIDMGDIDLSWTDRDVCALVKITRGTLAKLLARTAASRPGELDLRLACPVLVGGRRRWNPRRVRAVVEEALDA